MITMQYKIDLPSDYDMNIIRKRVQDNGSKTDGFKDLLLKAYLIIDEVNKKRYAPFYIWKDNEGMNHFIYEGFYDNILTSFGWQTIDINVPIKVELSDEIKETRYVSVMEHKINENNKMSYPSFSKVDERCLDKVLVYNPDKWEYVELYFYKEMPLINDQTNLLYEVLHISM